MRRNLDMALIDFILNLAAMLLWFHWRAARSEAQPGSAATTLESRPKRNRFFPWLSWSSLVALLALLYGRALVYRLLGPSVDWTATLDLGLITFFFRTEQLSLMLLFSFLSFVRVLVLAYSWLLVISIINRRVPATDPICRLIRRQLGPVAAWPIYAQLALPWLLVLSAWPGVHALLTYARIADPLPTFGVLMLQGYLISLGILLTLKYLIPPLLLVELITRYIYFGSSPFWDFLGATARNALGPLQRLPLRIGRLELAPLVGIALTLLLLHELPLLVLHELSRRNLTLWPH